MRLSHKDYEALQRALLELYAHTDMKSFRRAMPGIFLGLVPGEHFLMIDYHLDRANGTIKVLDFLEFDRGRRAGARGSGERDGFAHPLTHSFLEGWAPAVLGRVESFTGRRFYRFVGGQGVRPDTDIDRIISLPVTSGCGNACLINVGRRGKDYGARDRLILDQIRPHYNQACRKLRRPETLTAKRAGPARACLLTPRELEVLGWLCEGKSNPDIAAILPASVRTVEKHMERILDKLGVENRTAAALVAARPRAGR
jgi:DNA-binding CsgD family transcriptional regulator